MLNSIHKIGKQQYIYAVPGQFKSGDLIRTTSQGVTIQARVTVSHDLLAQDVHNVTDAETSAHIKKVTYVAVDNVTYKKVTSKKSKRITIGGYTVQTGDTISVNGVSAMVEYILERSGGNTRAIVNYKSIKTGCNA